MALCLFVWFALLGMKPSTLNMLGKHSPLSTLQAEFTGYFLNWRVAISKQTNPFLCRPDSKDLQHC